MNKKENKIEEKNNVKDKKKMNKLVAIILLIAILIVVIYIAIVMGGRPISKTFSVKSNTCCEIKEENGKVLINCIGCK